MQLQDKVIIITGGCQGLGRAMAEYLAAKGAKLALVDLNQEKLDETVAACKAAGTEARSYLCNVANEEQVTHMVAQVAEDFGAMSNRLGDAWWAEEKRTAKNYLASRRVLEMAERLAMAEGLKRPRWVKVPGVKPESILLLDMAKADLASREPHKIIKNAYRRQVKIHHPDAGGTAAAFRRIHAAYQDLLNWAEHPTFIRRRGFPDKWYYDGDHKRWIQPVPLKKG